MRQNSRRISRRTFLKGTATAAGALALASQLDFSWAQPLLRPGEEGAPEAEQYIPTACWIGKQDCGMLARKVDGRIVKFEGHPDHPRNLGTLCLKGIAQVHSLYDPYRVKAPLKRTNAKGVSGEWTEISWDEAIAEAGDRIKDIRSRNPKLLYWQVGRHKAEALYDNPFVHAAGAVKLGRADCSHAGGLDTSYTFGVKGNFHPDFTHCKYFLNMGWNFLNAGGNLGCWITGNRYFLDARERGMKTVTVDPDGSNTGPHTDRWLAIRPGTDLSFLMAVAHELVRLGFVDREYLAKSTNGASLVKADGTFIKEGEKDKEKELVWDLVTNAAKPFDAAGIDPALEGSYTVNGVAARPAFELFKEHVAALTPEWAEGICGIAAADIMQVAKELGENAHIGDTITLDGQEFVYRPVGAAAFRSLAQEHGVQAARALSLVFMLLGAFEAVGGLRVKHKRSLAADFAGMDKVSIKDPPYAIDLKGSKFFPLTSTDVALLSRTTEAPDQFGVDMKTFPEMLMLHFTNPLLSKVDRPRLEGFYGRFKYVVNIDPWMSETADLYADLVLPCAILEKYEGPLDVSDPVYGADSLRIPVTEPMFGTKSEADIYLELCERAGILYGEHGYLDQLNQNLKLKDEHKLPLDRKPEVRDIFDRWAKSKGIAEGVAYFETKGVKVSKHKLADVYASPASRTAGGARHRFYAESFRRMQDAMRAKGADERYWRPYTGYPAWFPTTMDGSPAQYDLYLLSSKRIEFKQNRSTFNPVLNEIAGRHYLYMNASTGRAKGISHEEEVWLETHNAVTGETKRARVPVFLTELLHPEAVNLPHHYGNWAQPGIRNKGVSANALYFATEGYFGMDGGITIHTKARVFRGDA